jgi:hypothetical protein
MIKFNTASLIFVSTLAICSTAAFANARVKGSDQTMTLNCKGGPAIVEGASNDVRFTGQCSSLTVTGADNEIVIDLAPGAKVTVTGASNDISWTSKGKTRPVVKVMGADNDIVRVR